MQLQLCSLPALEFVSVTVTKQVFKPFGIGNDSEFESG